MTFEEFLEKCREKDGWEVDDYYGSIRNKDKLCPLQAVFGHWGYRVEGQRAGLSIQSIIRAADGYTNGPYRKALLGLVKP